MINHKIAQLAHVEMLSPKPEETLWFFTELLGMQVTHREGQSVYLRAYQDTYLHSLVITESPVSGLGHAAFRTSSPEDLESLAVAIEAAGQGTGWIEPGVGQGKTFTFTTPDGHRQEIFWEVERYKPTDEERSSVASAVQMRPLRGVPVKRIDHVNLLAADLPATKKFFEDVLTFKTRERVELPDGSELGAWMSVSPFPHEVAIMGDGTGTRGRFHHVAYWYGNDTHLNDIAEALREREISIEAGPSKHGITQSSFLYCYEPSGNRVELFGSIGYNVLEPDWETRTWTQENLAIGGSVYGLELPRTFFAYGTPPVEITEEALTDGFRHAPAQMPVS
jgi:catechol 2,3-dioxygenase